jgi:hypothetical protein
VTDRVVHIQGWFEHILVTPTYDQLGFREFVRTTLWMAQPQYLREMLTWGFNARYQHFVRNAVRRFNVCEDCLRDETRCEAWINYVLDEYARTTGITFGRKTKEERSVAEASMVLGGVAEMTMESIQRAFRAAVLKAHPDLGGSAEAVQRVIEARDRLLEELTKHG